MPIIRKAEGIAYKSGLRTGDDILEINGQPLCDILDYMYLTSDPYLEVKTSRGTITIDNEDYMPLGIEFCHPYIDKQRSCSNKCIFCFIDQLPKNMRESLYYKDDDYRLSVLDGNYVTLTNMTETDINKLIRYGVPRINISVHTTDPQLRCRMLRNKNAGEVLRYIQMLHDAQIMINCQIVLCKGINDGAGLIESINRLAEIGENIQSVSVVPAGLTRHREGLYELYAHTAKDAGIVIDQITELQEGFLDERGSRFVFLGDEFYVLAKREIPAYEEYEDFPQIENGVGLMASFKYEYELERKDSNYANRPSKRPAMVTGMAAYKFLDELCGDEYEVFPIRNDFFGHSITVAGLVTGGDIIHQMKGKCDVSGGVLIPRCMLRYGEDVFLDDVSVGDVEGALGARITVRD